MLKKIILVLLFIAVLPSFAQQKKDKVLLTIEDKPVYVSEFLRVFNKNKDVVSEENRKNIEEYLELFINYKLKLQEAYELKMDTVPSYIKEFKKYKQQLVQPYLKDRVVTEKLIKEAYERSLKEVKARHILILVKPNASPNDTLKAFNKIKSIRDEIVSGTVSFDKMTRTASEDKYAKDNGGDLGYFSAFSMVYPFETAAYNTKKGEISNVFRTRFGYHIIKVDDIRDSKGEVKVAHVMIKNNKKDPSFAEKQINDIYQKFQQGEDFEFLAKKYSDDKSSGSKGGALRKFTFGKMIPSFAEASFSLKNEGDVSKPFKTKYGWHFVKLLKKYPIASYDKLKDELTTKVEKGDRSVLVGKSMANRLKKNYNIQVDKKVLDELLTAKNPSETDNKVFLTIENEVIKASKLRSYLLKQRNKNYKDFVDDSVINYYKNHLEDTNEEFASTIKEYREGLLLFDLLQKRIWTKAEKDTIGLQKFFDSKASNYQWKNRVKADIASCSTLKDANLVKQLLGEDKTIDDIKNVVNKDTDVNVIFSSGMFELDSKKLPKEFEAKLGVSKVYSDGNQHFTIVKVEKVLPKSQKQLKDARGKVISDYQDYIEKEWISELRATYSVKVHKKTLKKIIKNHKN
jgi:peptidyl-prolyl cis-trans isomerase SurA